MKSFAVNAGPGKPTIYVRTGDAVQTFTFNTKRQADKKILSLFEQGYRLDRTHETIKAIVSF